MDSAISPSREGGIHESLADADFATVGRIVLGFLRERFGFGLWMVTRVEEDDWIVLMADDQRYGVSDGDVFQWSDSFCSRMVDGRGPRVAPYSNEVPAYASAPIGQQVPIKAYVGIPIETEEGALFGTLCAIDPSPQPRAVADEQPLLELLAGLLGNILARERERDAERRRADLAELDALADPLTLLPNRRAWDQIVAAEESRCQRYGDPATIVVVDLDGLKALNDEEGHKAGDDYILKAADALRTTTREHDVVARLSGDEFALLATKSGKREAPALGERITEQLALAGVEASLGLAVRDPAKGLAAALEEADAAMYEAKRAASDEAPAPA